MTVISLDDDYIHPARCHDCRHGHHYRSACPECGEKHCDGEYTEKGVPWQLPKYRNEYRRLGAGHNE